MQKSPFKSHLIHSLVFLSYNLYTGFIAYQQGSFYGLIGQLGFMGLIFGLMLLSSFTSRQYLKVKELTVSIINSLVFLAFFSILNQFQYSVQTLIATIIYFLVFELLRMGISKAQNQLINSIADFISKSLPYIILIHFLIVGIGLTLELPAIYGQWIFLILGIPSLTIVIWLQIKQVSLNFLSKTTLSLTITACILLLSTFGVYVSKRFSNPKQLEVAYIMYEEGQFKDTQELTANILSYDPYNPDARFLNGCNLLALKAYEEAKNEFSYIMMNPNRKEIDEQLHQLIWYRVHLCDVGLGTAKKETIESYSKMDSIEIDKLNNVRSFKY